MNLKSLKKYKVSLSIFAIVLLIIILIVTLVKPNNKERFDPGDKLESIIDKMIDANGNKVEPAELDAKLGMDLSDISSDVITKQNMALLGHMGGLEAFIQVTNDDNRSSLVAYTEQPTNFDEICTTHGEIIEYSSDQFITDLNIFKEHLVGVWVGSNDPDAKIYLEFYQVNGVYNMIFMDIEDNGEINGGEVTPLTISNNIENTKTFVFTYSGRTPDGLAHTTMKNNGGGYTLLWGFQWYTQCNSGECFNPHDLIDLNTFLGGRGVAVDRDGDGRADITYTFKRDLTNINGGNMSVLRPNDSEKQYEYTIDFYEYDKTKFVLSFNDEKYVIKKVDEQLETQKLNGSGEIIPTTETWSIS